MNEDTVLDSGTPSKHGHEDIVNLRKHEAHEARGIKYAEARPAISQRMTSQAACEVCTA